MRTAPPPGFAPIRRASPELSVVEAIESPAQRAARLFAEARAEAAREVEQVIARLQDVAAAAQAISAGGEVYAAGVRQEAERAAETINAHAKRLEALMGAAR